MKVVPGLTRTNAGLPACDAAVKAECMKVRARGDHVGPFAPPKHFSLAGSVHETA